MPPEKRTWKTWNYAALWISMSLCIPTYMLASSLIGGGMNWWQAIMTIFLGNTIVLVPMILNGRAGAKYGIPFPVFARASFGVRGANIPAMLRAIVACGWFGIQTWIGGFALYQLLRSVDPGLWSICRCCCRHPGDWRRVRRYASCCSGCSICGWSGWEWTVSESCWSLKRSFCRWRRWRCSGGRCRTYGAGWARS